MIVVGFSGLIGKRHTKHVAEFPDAELVAVVDPSPGAQAVLDSLALPMHTPPALVPSVSALLSSGIAKPDAAIVCVPNHLHVPVATDLVNAGIHVLVEKPVSDSLATGEALVKLAHEKKVKLIVGHHRRFNPHVIAAKKALDNGEIGRVMAVSGLWTAFKPDPYFDADPALIWRKSHCRGGGVVLINFVHEADTMHYLLGSKVTRVHVEEISRQRPERRDASEAADSPEEGLAMTMKFASGVVGTYILSDAVASPHNFEMGTGENPGMPAVTAQGGEPVDTYRFFGTKGTLSFPDLTITDYATGVEQSWNSKMTRRTLPLDSDPRVPFERQLAHFIKVVKGEEEPNCSGEDGLNSLRVCNGIREALQSESGTKDISI
jgi:predicted dehydrogenase